MLVRWTSLSASMLYLSSMSTMDGMSCSWSLSCQIGSTNSMRNSSGYRRDARHREIETRENLAPDPYHFLDRRHGLRTSADNARGVRRGSDRWSASFAPNPAHTPAERPT
jgi:hypothetical protein